MVKRIFERFANAKKINIFSVELYLNKLGYTSLFLEQQWRHVTGKVKKGSKEYFFKLASSKEIAKRTQNEFYWNKMINDLPEENKPPITVPEVYGKGNYKSLFWFLSDYIDGELLVNPRKPSKFSLLEINIPLMAQTVKSIIEANFPRALPNDQGRKGLSHYKKTYLKRMENYEKLVNTPNSSLLLKFIKSKIKYMQFAPCHGDFAPWHIIIDSNKKLYLVDAEHSHVKGVKFYDFAYFCHRVYTSLKKPEIAKNFTKVFLEIYKPIKVDYETILLVLAHRNLVGYLDAIADKNIDTGLQDRLTSEILSGTFFNL